MFVVTLFFWAALVFFLSCLACIAVDFLEIEDALFGPEPASKWKRALYRLIFLCILPFPTLLCATTALSGSHLPDWAALKAAWLYVFYLGPHPTDGSA